MSEPFDLDAAVSASAGEPFRFTWGGETFELSGILERDIEEQLRLVAIVEELDEKDVDPGKLLEVIRLVVGADTLAEMRQLRPVGGAAMMSLLRAWMDHQGEALGKSAPSTRSSASTAKPSKRTSRSGRAHKTS